MLWGQCQFGDIFMTLRKRFGLFSNLQNLTVYEDSLPSNKDSAKPKGCRCSLEKPV